eukprot:760493-Hanusia_phi.AAC.1
MPGPGRSRGPTGPTRERPGAPGLPGTRDDRSSEYYTEPRSSLSPGRGLAGDSATRRLRVSAPTIEPGDPITEDSGFEGPSEHGPAAYPQCRPAHDPGPTRSH